MNKTIYRMMARSYGAYFDFLSHFSKDLAGEKAFQLFSTPRKGKVLPHQETYLGAARHQKVEINGLGIQTYHWPGPKETVLLVHGWESNTFRWHDLIQKLQENQYNIWAFDAPGHGYSEGTQLHMANYSEALQYLINSYDPAYLIGHSMGGMAMLYNQHLHPTNPVQKIVALAAPAEFSQLMAHYQRLLGFNGKVLDGLDAYLYEQYHNRIRDVSTPHYARKFTLPALIVHDELDTITPFQASDRLHQNWKNSRLITTTGLGHSLNGEAVTLEIIDFLNQGNQ